MIQAMQSNLAKAIAKKKKKNQSVTESERDTLNSLMNGGNYVEGKFCLASFNGIKKTRYERSVKTK